MVKAFIHIGYPKTGTSSIQDFLLANHDELKRNFFLYPKNGLTRHSYNAHHHLSPLDSEDWCPDIINHNYEELKSEILEHSLLVPIISTEHFSFINAECLSCLKEVFSEHKCQIVFYVRNQYELMQSTYLQLKKNETWFELSFSDFYNNHRASFDFNRLILPWEETFGKSAIRASLYHPEIIGVDVRHHFLECIGISDSEIVSKLNFSSVRANLSIHPLLLDIVSRIDQNGYLENRSEIINEILAVSGQLNGINYSLFTPEQEAEIGQYYLQSNAIFADKYLTPREKELLLKCGATSKSAMKYSLIQERDSLTKHRDLLAQERDTLAQDKDTLIQERDSLTKHRDLLAQERDTLAQDKDTLIQERDTLILNQNLLTQDVHTLQMELKRISNINLELQNSTSWRMTSPLRSVKNKFSKIASR